MAADQTDCTERIIDQTPDAAIIANLGVSAYILSAVDDRELNYYMRGAMGVTTPIGLGLATAIDDPVTVIEGDGSLLMSLGCLSTVGHADPSNLTIAVMDNSEFATTGGQPTLSGQVDFAGVAEDCGLEAYRVDTADDFATAYTAAVNHSGASLIAADVRSEKPESFPPIDYAHSFLKHRFRNAIIGSE